VILRPVRCVTREGERKRRGENRKTKSKQRDVKGGKENFAI
jgi:hypothetical protein